MANVFKWLFNGPGRALVIFVVLCTLYPWRLVSVFPSVAARDPVEQMVERMTLDEKLGQLILVEYVGTGYQASGLHDMIAHNHVGGLIYQTDNFVSPTNTIASVKAFSARANRDAFLPLLIATDQEGGRVNRLLPFHGPLISAREMAESSHPEVARAQGKQDALWLKELGMNVDLAPVVDVQTVDPPVLGSRLFGRDPRVVATYAGAFLTGLQQQGVIGCLKHFPGLGAVTLDPHRGLPIVRRSKQNLEAVDLAPYRALLQKEPPGMIMATDVLLPALDPDLPAELSPKIIDGLLRHEMGYQGVVVTDGLHMGGISARWTISQAAVLALLAGDDLVEAPFTVDEVTGVLAAFHQAVQEGKLTMERIDQSVERVVRLKLRRAL